MRGIFFVFEGIDGSGSSTQARLLHQHLVDSNRRAVLSAEPSEGPVGCLIRQILNSRVRFSADKNAREQFLACLFAADRRDHLYNEVNGVLRLLDEGVDVVSSRYTLSSFAYHVFDDQSRALVTALNAGFPLPDHTFYLDLPVEEAVKRICSSRVPDINEEAENLRRASRGYAEALSVFPGKLTILDARQPSALLSEKIRACVAQPISP